MKDNSLSMARPHITLFLLAVVVALIARLGLGIMDMTGTLAYDYISISGVPILDVICSILTGSAFVAFLFAASLALVTSTAGVALQGLLFARGAKGAGKPVQSFLWGWATALVAIVCLVIVASGILSPIQISSMSSKLPGTAVLVLALVVFAAFIGTLLAAASMVVCACLAKAKDENRAGWYLIIAAAICGLVVMILTINTFAAINVTSINMGTVGMWFGIDIVANLLILIVAYMFVRKAKA